MYDKMMNETRQFIDRIKKTPAYIDYLNYKSLIESQPELMQAVNDFRRKSFEIQISHNYGVYNAYENLVQLKSEHDSLLAQPVVKQFLNAELKLSKLVASIYECISEEIDLDLDFLS